MRNRADVIYLTEYHDQLIEFAHHGILRVTHACCYRTGCHREK
jgi:hypothetical protein